jgi:hypothetical protein
VLRRADGRACTRQNVQHVEQDACTKLGLAVSVSEAVYAAERFERAERMLAAGRLVTVGELCSVRAA